MSALNTSVVSAAATDRARLVQWGIVLGKKRILQGITLIQGLQYCEFCGDLVDLVL